MKAATLAPCRPRALAASRLSSASARDDAWKRLQHAAAYITSLEPDFQALSDAELRARTADFRLRLENGESLDEILFEAFAAVREARVRESDQRMFDVLMGGIVLHEGDIAEGRPARRTFVAPAMAASTDRAATARTS